MGTIYGLADAGPSSATDIVVTSAPAGVGFASYPVDIFTLGWSIFGNSFTVTSGSISRAEFAAEGSNPGSTGPHLLLNLAETANSLNNIDGQLGVVNFDGFAGLTFTRAPEPAPEPDAVTLLAVSLAGLGMVLRTRRA